eukprot:TRINITY_DN21181_c0_g2_i2.p3 TRINITY_DN21181_c0_g2~~TRINITY_DN21181_c0_g2_i2.p3  ORF type:complete len:176 (+),score=27.46 TRINITY_DN21181_c0_g2_i2:71-598(+)
MLRSALAKLQSPRAAAAALRGDAQATVSPPTPGKVGSSERLPVAVEGGDAGDAPTGGASGQSAGRNSTGPVCRLVAACRDLAGESVALMQRCGAEADLPAAELPLLLQELMRHAEMLRRHNAKLIAAAGGPPPPLGQQLAVQDPAPGQLAAALRSELPAPMRRAFAPAASNSRRP